MSPRVRRYPIIAMATAVVALAGCKDPYRSSTVESQATTVPRQTSPNEQPSSRPPGPLSPPTDPAGITQDPRAAIAQLAQLFINWSYQDLHDRQKRMANLTMGEARQQFLQAAQSTARDYELRRGKVGNEGSVRAITPDEGERGAWLVVTREHTTSADGAYAGLRPNYHVTQVTLHRFPDGRWAVAVWRPQS